MHESTVILTLIGFSLAPFASALESAKTLPRGVRNIMIRTVDTSISSKTDENGADLPLSEPLQKNVTFKRIIEGESSKLKQDLIRSFLLNNGFDESESVGEFTADLNGHIRVFAPVVALGLTDRLTLGLILPIYSAQTSVEMGFKPNERGQAFISELAKPENNLLQNAREAADRLNNAVGRLNDKLIENGYRPIENWSGTGLGDATVMTKYGIGDFEILKAAFTGGLVIPTGRRDDPDVLNDIAFGDGQWDVFGQFTFDQQLPMSFVVTEHIRYTNQLPGKKTVRVVTDDEAIEVPKRDVDFKLGDKVDYGVGIQYQPDMGLLLGTGLNSSRKFGDRYRLNNETSRVGSLEKNTDQSARYWELLLGFTSIPAFQRGELFAPFEIKLGYLRQLQSRNLPVTDFYQIDASVYF